nr:MAG TPA: hypothetical protein [Caudoviricetes sp.]
MDANPGDFIIPIPQKHQKWCFFFYPKGGGDMDAKKAG